VLAPQRLTFLAIAVSTALGSACGLPELDLRSDAEQEAVTSTRVTAAADTYVRSGKYADQNFGSAKAVAVVQKTAGTTLQGYLRFTVPASGPLTRARLRLQVTSASSDAADVYLTSSAWTEAGLTSLNRPPPTGAPIATVRAAALGPLEVELTGHVVPGSSLALLLVPRSADAFSFTSKESGAGPELLLEVGGAIADAGRDVGVPPGNDAGTVRPPDAGTPLIDAGTPVFDAGTPRTDAGAFDAGVGVIPVPSDCLNRTTVSALTGASTSAYGGAPANGSTVDARGASWTLGDAWLATPKASKNVCWLGGKLELTVDDTALSASTCSSLGYGAPVVPRCAWGEIWHHNGGFTLKYDNAGWIFDSVAIHHVGDAFNLSTGAQDITIRNAHLSDVRDDCVQNDDMHAVTVQDSFLDGCYVGFSARATAGVTPNDGHANVESIHDNLIWVKPMFSVYKGDAPGNGQIIKWEKTNPQLAPHLVFKNNVVRVGKLPFQTGTSGEDFYFPPDTDFAGNTLVWDGAGPVPASLSAWFNAAHGSTVTTNLATWDAAVASWKAAHPGVK